MASRFLYSNSFDSQTVTANSENASYPIANVQDSRLSRRWRTGSQTDYIDYGDCENALSPTLDGSESGLSCATWARSAAQKKAGTYSWLLSKTSAAAGGAAVVYLTDNTDVDDMHGLAAGSSYRLQVSTYSDAATITNSKVVVQEYYAAAWHDTLTMTHDTASEWGDLAETVTLTAATVAVSIRVEIDTSEDAGKLLYIDALSMYAENRVIYDAGSGQTFAPEAIAIIQHNISAAATIRLQANATDTWGSPSYDTTITRTSNHIVTFYSGLSEYRYWSISIEDYSNTDGYIEIGRIFGGPYLDMITNPRMAYGADKDDKSQEWESDSAQVYGELRPILQEYKIDYAFVDDDLRKLIDTMYASTAKVRPFLFVFDSDNLTNEVPIYARFAKEPKRKNVFNYKYDLSVTIKEVR